ncbi:hypothetical protein BJX64DRAFT_294551 [Aspergillus heterothallicus]
MTQTPPRAVNEANLPEGIDTEMQDAEPTRLGDAGRTSSFGPRPYPSAQHPHSQSTANVASDKFMSAFWKRTSRAETQQLMQPQPPYPDNGPQPQYPAMNQHSHPAALQPANQTQQQQQHQKQQLQMQQTQQQPQQQIHELAAGHPLPESPTVPNQGPFQTPSQSPSQTPDSTTEETQQPTQTPEQIELDLRRKIEKLETELSNRPTPEILQELQRTLDTETTDRQRLQTENARKAADLDVLRKRWKAAARELDKARSQNQGFYQVTDNYLIDLTQQLRYNIRNFAIQYFGGELKNGKPTLESKPAYWDKYMAPTTPGSLDCEVLIMSSERRPSVVQAFLWRFLAGHIFDQFRWAAENAITLRNLCRLLRPDCQYPDVKKPSTPEEERKFQAWVAGTTALVIEALNTPGRSRSTESRAEALAIKVRETLDPFLVVEDQSYGSELHRILDEALKLDKEICRQIARIEWVYPPLVKEVEFDPVTMRLGTGEVASKGDERQLVRLVVCPAMKKRGKSTGEDFNVETLLVPMEVSCEPVNAPAGPASASATAAAAAENSQSIQMIKEQTKIRWVAFVLGTVPQFVKLFASTGIPLTQLFGAMYLVSWLLFELLFLAAADVLLEKQPAATPAPPPPPRHTRSKWLWAHLAILCNAIVYMAPAQIVREELHTTVFYVSHLLHTVLFASASYVFWTNADNSDRFDPGDVRNFALLAVGGLATLASATVSQIEKKKKKKKTPWGWKGLLPSDVMAFAAFVQLPFLYYCLVYDSVGTHQSAWLQWLG